MAVEIRRLRHPKTGVIWFGVFRDGQRVQVYRNPMHARAHKDRLDAAASRLPKEALEAEYRRALAAVAAGADTAPKVAQAMGVSEDEARRRLQALAKRGDLCVQVKTHRVSQSACAGRDFTVSARFGGAGTCQRKTAHYCVNQED